MATLTDLILQVRQRADMVNSTFVSDAEVTTYINGSYSELYDILVSRFEDYYSDVVAFTLTSSNEYALPANLYKVRGLDFNIGSEWVTVRRWGFEDRNRINRATIRTLYNYDDRVYRVMGQNLIILPSDKAPGSYQLWIIPRFTPLSAGGDVLGDVLDFQDYIVVDAAIKCLLKEESDATALMSLKLALKARIEAMASNRDTTPERIVDVRGRSSDWGFGWGGF